MYCAVFPYTAKQIAMPYERDWDRMPHVSCMAHIGSVPYSAFRKFPPLIMRIYCD